MGSKVDLSTQPSMTAAAASQARDWHLQMEAAKKEAERRAAAEIEAASRGQPPAAAAVGARPQTREAPALSEDGSIDGSDRKRSSFSSFFSLKRSLTGRDRTDTLVLNPFQESASRRASASRGSTSRPVGPLRKGSGKAPPSRQSSIGAADAPGAPPSSPRGGRSSGFISGHV